MFIESNKINNLHETNYFVHDGKILYGKPKGTFFFREHANVNLGAMQLVVSAGGTRIAVLTLKQEEQGKISIEQTTSGKVNKLVFNCESEFVNYIRGNKLVFPAFPKKFIKLEETVSEYNSSVRSLKHLAAVSILKNTIQREKAFDDESDLLSEELVNYLLKVDDQLDAARVTFK